MPVLLVTALIIGVVAPQEAFGGAGPLLVGMLSDFLEPTLGIESLRYAMVAGILFMGWGVVHFWLSSRHFRGELI